METLENCDQNSVSGTFHLMVDLSSPRGEVSVPTLVKVTDYSNGFRGSRWRFVEVGKGLIGRYSRTRVPEHVSFADPADYNERMVEEFGDTEDEIKEHTRDGRSYWAQPVFSGKEQIRVLFLFSTEQGVFPAAADPNTLANTAKEIAARLSGAQTVWYSHESQLRGGSIFRSLFSNGVDAAIHC